MAGYKIQAVQEKFDGPNKFGTILPMERLACGHVIVDPDLMYGNETAVKIAAASFAFGAKRNRRCYECKKVA